MKNKDKNEKKLHTKNKSRWIKDQNMKNLLEDSIEGHFYDFRLEGFPTQKTQIIKENKSFYCKNFYMIGYHKQN